MNGSQSFGRTTARPEVGLECFGGLNWRAVVDIFWACPGLQPPSPGPRSVHGYLLCCWTWFHPSYLVPTVILISWYCWDMIFSLLSPCSLLETTSFGLFFCLFEIKHGDECVCNVFRSTCYSLIVLHMVTPCSEPMHVSTEEMIITSAFFCKENEDEEDCIIVSCL